MVLDELDGAQVSRGRRLSAPPSSGAFGAWLVVPRDGADSVAKVLGVASMRWTVVPVSGDPSFAHAAPGPSGTGGVRGSWGSLQYLVHEAARLEHAVELPRDFNFSDPLVAQRVSTLCTGCSFSVGLSLDNVCDALELLVTSVFMLSAAAVANVHGGLAGLVVCSVVLGRRVLVSSIIPGQPSMGQLRRLRKIGRESQPGGSTGPDMGDGYEDRYNNAFLHLPSWAERFTVETMPARIRLGRVLTDTDPVKLFEGLNLCQYLRSTRYFTPAANASHRFDHGDAAQPRDSRKDPSRTKLDRSKCILDVVDMAFDRRQFRADRIFDTIESICLCSDSSPVTGEEMQGMVADIVYNDQSTRRTTLPGSSLAYGTCNSITKCVALLWAVF